MFRELCQIGIQSTGWNVVVLLRPEVGENRFASTFDGFLGQSFWRHIVDVLAQIDHIAHRVQRISRHTSSRRTVPMFDNFHRILAQIFAQNCGRFFETGVNLLEIKYENFYQIISN